MDNSLCNQLMDITDDSGFVTQSSYGNSSSRYSSGYTSLSHMDYSQNTSLSYYKTPQLSSNSITDYKCLNNESLNESLPHNFEKFVLNSTPNYYVERTEFRSVLPTQQMTPSKSQSKYSSNVKLGSPERNEILYQKLKVFTNTKNKTPQKIFKKYKSFSPAKKRLFESEKVDPVTFFVNNRRNLSDILNKIMFDLNESDLCTFRRVSSKWRDALDSDEKNYARYCNYVNKLQLDKENSFGKNNSYEKLSIDEDDLPYISPRKRKFNECIELGKMLKFGQTITKCQQCQAPSIVERNISQCPRRMCGYINCLNCGSFSTTGPENFIDKCKSSILIVDKPKLPRRLTDSPPKEIDPNELPFFLRDTTNLTYNNNELTDSGNKTQTVLMRQRLSIPTNLFQSSNRNSINNNSSFTYQDKPAIATVLPCNEKQKEIIIEPSSPPKVTNIACSKQSKKRIKRRLVI